MAIVSEHSPYQIHFGTYFAHVDDDDLIVYNVVILHDCIARERICPSSLIEITKKLRRSTVFEVQEVRYSRYMLLLLGVRSNNHQFQACYQFLKFIETLDYDQIVETNPAYLHWDKPVGFILLFHV
jgi:hypothetical protein